MLRPIKIRVTELLRQIYLGDECRVESCADTQQGYWSGLSRVHSDENGKITLISTVTMMFFLILVCYIGNVGIAVKQKMELQNAADAAGYSAVLWQARGMNAITVSNHMLGESTAILVMLESLGGRILDEGGEHESSQSVFYNSNIETLKETAPNPTIRSIDAKIVDFVADLLTDDDGTHEAGATIYDAKLTLKYAFTLALVVKSLATALDIVGNIPFLAWLKPIAIGADVAMTLGPVLKVGQEWLFLEALQGIAKISIPFQKGVATLLIPAVAAYAATAAGQSPASAGSSVGLGDSPLQRAASDTLDKLGEFYGSQQIDLVLVPAIDELKLPVKKEDGPPDESNSQGVANVGSWEMPPSEWDGPFLTGEVMSDLQKANDAIRKVTRIATSVIETALDLVKLIPGMSEGPFKEALDKIEQTARLVALDLPVPDARRGFRTNPSHDPSSDYRLADCYWQHERKSQWVRATYPYVESFRDPMVDWMKNGWAELFNLNLSNAATYYVHWTNRYTIDRSFRIRSGEYSPAAQLTPAMFVMESFDPDKKGNEPWTSDDQAAEKMFALYAIAYRPQKKTPFASTLFPKPTNDGSIAISAAMLYNANGRDLQSGNSNELQPNTGWDTLNWLPSVQAHQWGDHSPGASEDQPWEVFGGKLNSNQRARVQINWQSKLIPISFDGQAPQKLQQDTGDMPANMKELLNKALEAPELIKH